MGVEIDTNVPDMVFEGKFSRTHYLGTRKDWELVASNADVYEKQKKTYIYDVTMVKYRENGSRESFAKADMGIYYQGRDTVDLYSNVVIISTNNIRLETPEVTFYVKEQRFETTNRVLIKHPDGHWMRGVGMSADFGLSRAVIYNEIDEGNNALF